MSEHVSRRDFLKVASLGAATSAVLTGCGPAARYVTRQPYSVMPEYTLPGKSTFFATTCGECPAGCGLVVRTVEGRAQKIEGNPNHPLNRGKTCSRGQAALQGLYHPDRLKGPVRQTRRGSGILEPLNWQDAVNIVKDALSAPGEIAILLGLFPDHLAHLLKSFAEAANGFPIYRFSTLGEIEERVTLMDAAQKVIGVSSIPSFDLAQASLIFSFGANFSETWLSPVAYSRMYGLFRQGRPGQRGYLVHFEPRMSQTAAIADEWIPINPGSEAQIAQALVHLVATVKNTPQASGSNPGELSTQVDISEAAAASGISVEKIQQLARLFAEATSSLALPGGAVLGYANGLATAEAILSLNVLAGNIGRQGGIYVMPESPLYPTENLNALPTLRPNTLAEIAALVDHMKSGKVKTLLIHTTNPVYGLPRSLGFVEALQQMPQVISFSPFLDETAQQADYIFPDHTPLESWGYQQVVTGCDRMAISGLQPVVAPLYDTRSTADVLLAAARAAGGKLATQISYTDEVDYLQNAITPLMEQNGIYQAAGTAAFWSLWQQNGGWWKKDAGLDTPPGSQVNASTWENIAQQSNHNPADYPYYLIPFPHLHLGDGSVANRPWLQETPDSMTTAMWDTWVEINPQTAHTIGVKNDDVVKISSALGDVEAIVYEYPAIHPQAIAIPLGQGHTGPGHFAKDVGANPLELLDSKQNEAGNLAYLETRVKVTPTGKRRQLARYESKAGVYGQRQGESSSRTSGG